MKKYFNNKNFSKNEENFQENLLAEAKSHSYHIKNFSNNSIISNNTNESHITYDNNNDSHKSINNSNKSMNIKNFDHFLVNF